MKKQAGFTLMELMVVIAIIGILSAIAVPNIISWRNNAQVNSAARGLYSDLQGARSTAVKENTDCTISFDASGSGSYTISMAGKGDKIVNFSSFGAVKMDALKDSGGDAQTTLDITFRSTGFPFSGGVLSGVAVDLKGASSRRVILTPAGNVRIEAI